MQLTHAVSFSDAETRINEINAKCKAFKKAFKSYDAYIALLDRYCNARNEKEEKRAFDKLNAIDDLVVQLIMSNELLESDIQVIESYYDLDSTDAIDHKLTEAKIAAMNLEQYQEYIVQKLNAATEQELTASDYETFLEFSFTEEYELRSESSNRFHVEEMIDCYFDKQRDLEKAREIEQRNKIKQAMNAKRNAFIAKNR